MRRFPVTLVLRLVFLACVPAVTPLRPSAAQVMALAGRGPRFLLAPASGGAPVEVDASRGALLRRAVSLKVKGATVGRMLAAIEAQLTLVKRGTRQPVVANGAIAGRVTDAKTQMARSGATVQVRRIGIVR